MALTTNKGYNKQAVGSNVNTWGLVLNNNYDIQDKNLGGLVDVDVSGNTDVTASSAESQNLVQNLIGVLTGNISYLLPEVGSFYIINNQTTGGYTVTVKTTAMASVGVDTIAGEVKFVYSDDTDVIEPGSGGGGSGDVTGPGSAVSGDIATFSGTSGKVIQDSGKLISNAVFKNVVTVFTKQQNFGAIALTDGASIAWNLDNAQSAKVTLGGNRTLANPTNMVDGGTYILRVTQDGTGSRTLAYGSAYKWPDGSAPVLSTAAGAVDIITFVSNGSVLYGVIQKAFS